MTKAQSRKPPASAARNDAMNIRKTKDEDMGFAVARTILGPNFRHALATSQLVKAQFGAMEGTPGFSDYADAIGAKADMAAKGDLAFASRMLAAQAVTLDTIFTETARRMAGNMGEHLGAMEIYARIALKAQAHSRATLEALGKLHQPREQTVRHVHVNDGGQAVIAGQLHHHAGGTGNVESTDQPHESCRAAGKGPAMLGQEPSGHPLPNGSHEGESAMQAARWQK